MDNLTTAFGNPAPGTAHQEAAEVARDLADPAAAANAAPSAPTPVAPAADAEPVAPTRHQDSDRNAIAERFKNRRSTHDAANRPEHVPPFVDRAAEDAQAAAPAPADAGQSAVQAPAAPVPAAGSYTLKVRGQEMAVDRAQLLKLADVEAHEEKDFDDARLIRYAQKNAAADMLLQDARQTRDQARAAAPAPAGPQFSATPQQPAAPAQPEVKDFAALTRDYHEKVQFGTPEEATAAFMVLDQAREQQRAAQQAEQQRSASFANDGQTAVQAFATANPDMQNNPLIHDAMVMTVTREMEADLRRAGITDEYLTGSIGNPAAISDLYRQARHHGLQVRSQSDLLDAAGRTVRAGFGLPPAPAAAPAPGANSSSAAPSRLDEKRGLQAQPLRSGNPPAVTPPVVDQMQSRKSAIAQMQRARTAPNTGRMTG